MAEPDRVRSGIFQKVVHFLNDQLDVVYQGKKFSLVDSIGEEAVSKYHLPRELSIKQATNLAKEILNGQSPLSPQQKIEFLRLYKGKVEEITHYLDEGKLSKFAKLFFKNKIKDALSLFEKIDRYTTKVVQGEVTRDIVDNYNNTLIPVKGEKLTKLQLESHIDTHITDLNVELNKLRILEQTLTSDSLTEEDVGGVLKDLEATKKRYAECEEKLDAELTALRQFVHKEDLDYKMGEYAYLLLNSSNKRELDRVKRFFFESQTTQEYSDSEIEHFIHNDPDFNHRFTTWANERHELVEKHLNTKEDNDSFDLEKSAYARYEKALKNCKVEDLFDEGKLDPDQTLFALHKQTYAYAFGLENEQISRADQLDLLKTRQQVIELSLTHGGPFKLSDKVDKFFNELDEDFGTLKSVCIEKGIKPSEHIDPTTLMRVTLSEEEIQKKHKNLQAAFDKREKELQASSLSDKEGALEGLNELRALSAKAAKDYIAVMEFIEGECQGDKIPEILQDYIPQTRHNEFNKLLQELQKLKSSEAKKVDIKREANRLKEKLVIIPSPFWAKRVRKAYNEVIDRCDKEYVEMVNLLDNLYVQAASDATTLGKEEQLKRTIKFAEDKYKQFIKNPETPEMFKLSAKATFEKIKGIQYNPRGIQMTPIQLPPEAPAATPIEQQIKEADKLVLRLQKGIQEAYGLGAELVTFPKEGKAPEPLLKRFAQKITNTFALSDKSKRKQLLANLVEQKAFLDKQISQIIHNKDGAKGMYLILKQTELGAQLIEFRSILTLYDTVETDERYKNNLEVLSQNIPELLQFRNDANSFVDLRNVAERKLKSAFGIERERILKEMQQYNLALTKILEEADKVKGKVVKEYKPLHHDLLQLMNKITFEIEKKAPPKKKGFFDR